jgi:hypothetical protein
MATGTARENYTNSLHTFLIRFTVFPQVQVKRAQPNDFCSEIIASCFSQSASARDEESPHRHDGSALFLLD